jgi:hypothetical protein
LGINVIGRFEPLQCSVFLLRRYRPDALEGQFGSNVFVKLIVVGEMLFQQVLLRSEPHSEKARRELLLDVASESTAAHENPFRSLGSTLDASTATIRCELGK